MKQRKNDMTKDEALKLALEALGAYLCATDDDEDVKAHNLMAEAFFKLKEVLAQPPEERNFCPRCGKRAGKNAWDVHTCSLPEENT